jgi:hypothetical protein
MGALTTRRQGFRYAASAEASFTCRSLHRCSAEEHRNERTNARHPTGNPCFEATVENAALSANAPLRRHPPQVPPQAELARMANVSSTDTVWRALSILRCTRWLVASQKKCCRGNRHEPCVYVVNATPLPIADTLFLDPDYLALLEKCTKHIHARVRSVAGVVLSQLPGDSAIGQREQPQSLAR